MFPPGSVRGELTGKEDRSIWLAAGSKAPVFDLLGAALSYHCKSATKRKIKGGAAVFPPGSVRGELTGKEHGSIWVAAGSKAPVFDLLGAALSY